MKVSGTSMAILVCALVLISGVSAENVDNSAGYSVIPAGNLYLPVAASPMTAGTITQGQTHWYTVIVPAGATSITADLNWGYVPDSL
ncbi:MAG: peptidase domain-containing protein, partial [Methanoregula sp.]|nr:peptidase domain-containing protein [Methanoregula sp.]